MRRSTVRVALLVCLLTTVACGANARVPQRGADHPSATPPRLTGEPVAGVSVARHKLIDGPVGSGNGSLLISYEVGTRCYLRRIYPDGMVAGWFTPKGSYCPSVDGNSTGFIDLGWEDPLNGSADLSEPPSRFKIAADDPGRRPHAGDTFEGPCTDLYEDEASLPIPAKDAKLGCAYSPKDRTFYRIGRDTLAIDPAGRVWSLEDRRTITVTDGSHHWHGQPLPSYPEWLLTSGGDAAAVWVEDRDESMFVTSDAGRTWQRVTETTSSARNAALAVMLPDGRLVLGPDNGQLWRGEDSTNQKFESFGAGPLTTLVSAGKLLYGLADLSQDRALHDLVWMSADGGSTWRQVLGENGAVASEAPVPAEELQLPQSSTSLKQISRFAPIEVAVNDNGLVLVGYGLHAKRAWRLYDRQDRIVAQGLDGHGGEPAGAGFLLNVGDGVRFLDSAGSLTPVDWRDEARPFPLAAGDVWVPQYGVYRPGTRQVFDGSGSPNGQVSTVDGRGRWWALASGTHGRTVVEWGRPGGPWTSRDLGPSIGAREVDGTGSTLIVSGNKDLYISLDMGKTWKRVTHGAVAYSGPPFFGLEPDGTLVGGDARGTVRVSHDHGVTFQDGSADQPRQLGDLFARGNAHEPEISRDGVHWFPFTPANARRLLVQQSTR